MKTTPEENTIEVEESRKEYGLLFGAVLNYDQQLMESIWDWHHHQLQKAHQEEREAFCTILERLYQAGDERKQMTFEYLMRIRAKDAVKTPDHSQPDQNTTK